MPSIYLTNVLRVFQDESSASKQRIEAFVSEMRHKRRPSLAFRISSDTQTMTMTSQQVSAASSARFKFKLHLRRRWRNDFLDLFTLLKEDLY